MPSTDTLSEWFSLPQGEYLLTREQEFFDQAVADIFGFNAIQMGLPEHDFLRASRMTLRASAAREKGAHLQLDLDALPIDTGSLDLVLLPHVLEFNPHPHQILREVERVLMPEGQVLISGFNPRSLWGVRRALGSKAGYPWCGNFISLPRMKDWLALLGFEVVAGRFACYAPPLTNSGLARHLRFMEPAGDRWWAVCGGVYFLQAIKRVPGVHLIKPSWNKGLVTKLLPVTPKLNRGAPQKNRMETP